MLCNCIVCFNFFFFLGRPLDKYFQKIRDILSLSIRININMAMEGGFNAYYPYLCKLA